MLTSPCLSVESLFGPGAKAKELAVCSWSSTVTGAQGTVSGASGFSRPCPDNQITTLTWSDNSERLVGRSNRYGVSWAQTHSFPRSKPTSGTIVPWLWPTGLSSATYLLKWSSATKYNKHTYPYLQLDFKKLGIKEISGRNGSSS